MKNIIYYSLLICILFLFQNCSNEEVHPDLKLFQLNGKVKSLKYKLSTNGKDKICPGVGMDFYGSNFTYKFNKEGKWVNPKGKIKRNKDGYIVQINNFEIEWDNNNRLKARREIFDEPYVNNLEYNITEGGYVDYLLHIDGGDGGIKHNYMYDGNNDEQHNWLNVRIVRSYPAFENQYYDEFEVERIITYWENEKNDSNDYHKKENIKSSSTQNDNSNFNSRNYSNDYDSSNNIKENVTSQNDIWRHYIGTWEYVFVSNVHHQNAIIAGYDGHIALKINITGTASIKIVKAGQFGQPNEILLYKSGDIVMNGNTLTISGTSISFILKDYSIYMESGIEMHRNYNE